MPKLTAESFLSVLKQSGLLDKEHIKRVVMEAQQGGINIQDSEALAVYFTQRELLTQWQVDKLQQGKHKGFTLGKYRLLRLLGKGGMSSVYLAEHILMRRRCAIKVLPIKRVNDSSYLARFHREAQAVASLDHPNIVRAYDIDHETDKDTEIHFLVMEYVSGRSLQEVVKEDGPLSAELSAAYIAQAALGLDHAHKAGLVHRDVKPGNLLVDLNGVVKLLDLGLALFSEKTEENPLTVTHDEKVLGTADYLSPEQALDSHLVDLRADVYSLGCTIYFCLTGHPPFKDGTLTQRLMWHQTKDPVAVNVVRPDVSESFVAIVKQMMAKRPEDRFQTMAQVADALLGWLHTNASPEFRQQFGNLLNSGSSINSGSGTKLKNQVVTVTVAPQAAVPEVVPPAAVAPIAPLPVSTPTPAAELPFLASPEPEVDSGLGDFLKTLQQSPPPQAATFAPEPAPAPVASTAPTPVAPTAPAPTAIPAPAASPVIAPLAAAVASAPPPPAVAPAVAVPAAPAPWEVNNNWSTSQEASSGVIDFHPTGVPVASDMSDTRNFAPPAAAVPMGLADLTRAAQEAPFTPALAAPAPVAPLAAAAVVQAATTQPLSSAAPVAAAVAAPSVAVAVAAISVPAPVSPPTAAAVVTAAMPVTPVAYANAVAAQPMPVQAMPAQPVSMPATVATAVIQPSPVAAAVAAQAVPAQAVVPAASAPAPMAAQPVFDQAPPAQAWPQPVPPQAAAVVPAPVVEHNFFGSDEPEETGGFDWQTPAPAAPAPPMAASFLQAGYPAAAQPVVAPTYAAPVADPMAVAAQPFPAQATPQQPQPGQFAPAQFVPGQPMPGQPMPGQPYGAEAYAGQAYGQPMAAPVAAPPAAPTKKPLPIKLIGILAVVAIAIGVGVFVIMSPGGGAKSPKEKDGSKVASSSKDGKSKKTTEVAATTSAGSPKREPRPKPAPEPMKPVTTKVIDVGPEGHFKQIGEALSYLSKEKQKYSGTTSRGRANVTLAVAGGTTHEAFAIDNGDHLYPSGIHIIARGARAKITPREDGLCVRLLNVENFRLENFDLDAGGKDAAVEVVGYSIPALGKLSISGFGKVGINALGLAADGGEAIIQEVEFRPANNSAVGIRFGKSLTNTRYVTVKACRFVGPMKTGIEFAASAQQIQLRENIFDQSEVGVSFAADGEWKFILLGNNTFNAQTRAGISFLGIPGGRTDNLVLHRNLFTKGGGPELLVENGFQQSAMETFIYARNGEKGIQGNFTDRKTAAEEGKGEFEIIDDAKQRGVAVTFASTDPKSTDYYMLSGNSPVANVPNPSASLMMQPFAGARPKK